MTNKEEIWKDIPGYEGYYQVSSLGRLRSKDRLVNTRHVTKRPVKGQMLKPKIDRYGYYQIGLQKLRKTKYTTIHQLVAMAFHDHVPCGYDLVINHINFIKTDNRPENLEIVSTRENSNKKHLKSGSKYVGVDFYKRGNKWRSRIEIDGKSQHLGYFTEEYDAHLAYKKALKELLDQSSL